MNQMESINIIKIKINIVYEFPIFPINRLLSMKQTENFFFYNDLVFIRSHSNPFQVTSTEINLFKQPFDLQRPRDKKSFGQRPLWKW